MKNRTRFFLIVAAVFLVACNSNSTPPRPSENPDFKGILA